MADSAKDNKTQKGTTRREDQPQNLGKKGQASKDKGRDERSEGEEVPLGDDHNDGSPEELRCRKGRRNEINERVGPRS